MQRRRYWDVNIGAQYSQQEDKWGYYLGAALYHAATPQDGTTTATGGTSTIPARISLQGGYNMQLGRNNALVVSSVADFQAGNKVVSVGVLGKFGINDPTIKSFNFGIWNRFGDAIIPAAGFEFERMLFTLSYDIITSSIKTIYNDVQSFELGFAWQLGKPANNSRVLRY